MFLKYIWYEDWPGRIISWSVGPYLKMLFCLYWNICVQYIKPWKRALFYIVCWCVYVKNEFFFFSMEHFSFNKSLQVTLTVLSKGTQPLQILHLPDPSLN